MKKISRIVLALMILAAVAAGGYLAYTVINEPIQTPAPPATQTFPPTSGTDETTVPEVENTPQIVPETRTPLPAQGIVSTTALNVRACGDYYSCAILTTVPEGTLVRVDLCDNGWAHIYEPTTGWVNTNYLNKDICK